MKSALAAILSILILYNFAVAQSEPSKETPEILELTIETAALGAHKLIDTIDIQINSFGYLFAGTDLKIGLDAYAIDILEILRGEILDSCAWELFDVKASIDQGKENYPRSIWTILALSDFMPDTVRPGCYGFGRPASIARLVVALDSTRARVLNDSLFPIYFFWEDCTDNTVTNVSGDTLMMSIIVNGVYSATGASSVSPGLTPPGNTPARAIEFPSRFGAPEHCISPRVKNKPVRKLLFKSGGVRLQSVVDNN
jgi:hypothetical protein